MSTKIVRRGPVTVTRPSSPKDGNWQIVNNQINIQSNDRSPKDIGTWRTGHQAAESVHSPNRCRLYDVYNDVLLDGHLSGIISKRFDAVLNKEIHFMKGETRVEEMDVLIGSLRFREVVRTILETLLWGISGLEFIPGKELSFLKMRRKHIKPDIGIYALQQNGREGFNYLEMPNLWVIGDKEDLGLLLKCSPYALYKRGGMADWAQYNEIFGMPVRIIKYDAYDTQTKIELDKVLSESGSALAIKIPKQADFEMMDGKQSNGNGELQQKFIQALNNEMSIIVLGNTETTSSDNGGSNAKSQTHADQQLEITKSDIAYVQNMLNDPAFLAILQSYGWPVQGGEFIFAKEVDRVAISEQIKIVQTVKQLGTPIDDDYIYELTGIPKPKNYEKLKKEKELEKKVATQQRAAALQNLDNDPWYKAKWEEFKGFFAEALG